MKIFKQTLLIFCLLSIIKSTCSPENESSKIRKDKDCRDRSFDQNEIDEGAFRCCYLEVEMDSIDFNGKKYSCVAINEAQFNNIKSYKKSMENQSGIDKVKIDCKSSYIHYGLLIVFFYFIILF